MSRLLLRSFLFAGLLTAHIRVLAQVNSGFSSTNQNLDIPGNVRSGTTADFKNATDSIQPHRKPDLAEPPLSQPTPLFIINVPTGLCMNSERDRAEQDRQLLENHPGIALGPGSICP